MKAVDSRTANPTRKVVTENSPKPAGVPPPRKIRDCFWLWGHGAGSHNPDWNLPAQSRISPLEAALYMNIPNLIRVRYGGESLPSDPQGRVPFRGLREMVWSIVGGGGAHQAEELARHTEVVRETLELAPRLPNLTGVMMDDFFRGANSEDAVGGLSLAKLGDLRRRLAKPNPKLDLWVVLYSHQMSLPVKRHLESCDCLTFWTWKAQDLQKLEESFGALEAIKAPAKKYLGCYMWDYGEKRPMPLEAMRRQCQLGLRWLQEGRIAGMIFLASCICDLELEAVEWTRQWIREVGDIAR